MCVRRMRAAAAARMPRRPEPTHVETGRLPIDLLHWLVALADDRDDAGLWSELATDAVPASLAVFTFLAMSRIMDHSGQTLVLASGVAEVTPPTVFAFFAASIGLLGSFMTSSNTASNVLFGPLQQSVAQAGGLSEATIISAPHAGGAIGNAISPANVVLGTSTTGIVGREGDVLRSVLPWNLVVAGLTGLATVALLLL